MIDLFEIFIYADEIFRNNGFSYQDIINKTILIYLNM